jgi:hypothetical protein
MATFRNAQIEDILNDERSMNRVILDRTSAHISAIGDEKAPATTRDIKNEAVLGGLVDAVKEKLNKAIQLISGFQYGGLDENKASRLLGLDTKNQLGINAEVIKREVGISKAPETDKDNKTQEESTLAVGDSSNVAVGTNIDAPVAPVTDVEGIE